VSRGWQGSNKQAKQCRLPSMTHSHMSHAVAVAAADQTAPLSNPYLCQHDDSTGVQSQEGSIAEAVFHQQAAHEG